MNKVEDEDPFVPLRPIFGTNPRDRQELRREAQIAEHVTRHRENGGGPGRRARGLEVADIVTVAVTVADAEGTDAINMRRIARELNVGTMSLYWYVESKDELHRLMLERVSAEAEAPEPSGDWRADLSGYARTMRDALLRHPWAIDFIGMGPPSGPNDARNAERLLAAVDGLGLDITTALWILMTVWTYVAGAALREVQEIRWQRSTEAAAGAMAATDVATMFREFERRIRESGRYPQLVRALDEGVDPDAPETRDDRFEFGLDCVLDGIAARLRS
jgi:AcrR family transcriptional regulator